MFTKLALMVKIFILLLHILSLYMVNSKGEPTDDACIVGVYPMGDAETVAGMARFPSNTHGKLYVFGENFDEDTRVGICISKDCMYVSPAELNLQQGTHGHLATLSLETPDSGKFWYFDTRFYICLKDPNTGNWTYQGFHDKIGFFVYKSLLTPVVAVVLIIACYCLSSLMSGLNIGLLAFDINELQLMKNAGSPTEKKYATKIAPLRRNGNFLLCSIVITITLCNGISTVSINNIVSSWVAVAITTIVIVLFCEIIPQAICTYYPLLVGYYTRYITKTCMIVTSPVSYPLSKMLNLVVGKEVTAVYTKDRLKELLKITKLPSDEQMIISGTLDLNKKRVEEVMTALDDVFELPINAVLDFETIASILASGNSRIPIYVGNRCNINYMLLVKDLALLDPDTKVPIKSLVQQSQYKCTYIRKGTNLDDVYVLFKTSRIHIAFVVDDRGILHNGEKQKHVIGLITFEDVIEEILQSEINDETDAYTDNKSMRKLSVLRATNELIELLSNFRRTTKVKALSGNMKIATQQFLATLDLLSVDVISSAVLSKLLELDIYYNAPGNNSQQDKIFVRGVRSDFFVMVLEGTVEVKFKGEGLTFEAGAFRYFGIEALRKSEGFIPSFSVEVIRQTKYMKVTGVLYNAAMLATIHERTGDSPKIDSSSELFKHFNKLTTRASVT